MPTLANTIQSITKTHLEEKKGRLYAQCVRAVGWIGGTVPDTEGIVELPTSDVSNGGVVVGAALAGERPIYVIRYQGFTFYNMVSILNYAAKSLEMWGQPCPVLVRALGMEGSIGPVASNMHHSMVMRMPGINVYAPITPKEWETCYNVFMADNQPYFFSESRQSLTNEREFDDYYAGGASHTLFLVGPIRLQYDRLRLEFPNCNIVNLFLLKPIYISERAINALLQSKSGIAVDSDYTICGAAEHIAYELMHKTGKRVHAIGLENKTAGFSREMDNVTPTIEQIKKVLNAT